MKADEGEFLDRINKINMIFEKGIRRERLKSRFCPFMSFMFLLSKIGLPSNRVNLVNPVKIQNSFAMARALRPALALLIDSSYSPSGVESATSPPPAWR